MTTNNFSNSSSKMPNVGLVTMFRLGLFQMALGIMAILTLGILNRVMISELGIPATVAAGVLAMHQIVAPARVWFGQLSDSKPIFGLHRSGYVWIGTLSFTCLAFLAVQVIWQLGSAIRLAGGWVWNGQTIVWTGVLAAIFLSYGLAISSSSTPFTALLVDVSEEDNRSKIVGTAWSMLMLGIVIAGIAGGVVLKNVQQSGVILGANLGSSLAIGEQVIETPLEVLETPLNNLFLIVAVLVWGLALLATWGVEQKYSRYRLRSSYADREDKITLNTAIKVLTASRQTGIFFGFLMVMTISLFMQEAVLEPYGGEIFQMSIPETTQLNAFWGMGTLIGVSTTGFTIVPHLGKRNTIRLGCILVAITFGLIIVAGVTQEPKMLQSAVFLFGLAAGITTTGGISLMLDLTAAETAGTFIGAWGLAQAIARALATVSGGIILDLGKFLFKSPLGGYSLVFGLQAVGMLLAITILNQVNVREFKENTQEAIATVMAGDLD